ncbi:MAG: N-carbamoyl-D-amino-acid hydrolase [Proteobacteria bacterium]|nr:N-carbamoyl-D-amino-acid hydrolase [Pseudomonadota bacterium]
MARNVTVGAAQMGPIARNESRQVVVSRLLELLRQAHGRGCDLVVFPELTLTTFFPRWWMEDPAEIESFFEREMPGPAVQPLFDEAKRLEMGFSFGYGELADEGGKTHRYNTSILVDKSGAIVGKYRKIHLPGHADHRPEWPFQHLEKYFFEVGDLGFGVWDAFGGKMGMCICNDRRWPETYRVMGLKGVELVMLGYNTPTHIPWEPIYDDLTGFHNHLSMQSGAYQNSTWVVGVAKAGMEEGCNLLAGTCIIAPSGEIVALTATKDDELISHVCDLDLAQYNKKAMFDFAQHRRPEHYGIITERAGPV